MMDREMRQCAVLAGYASVGILKEILMDQGTAFMSRTLRKLYQISPASNNPLLFAVWEVPQTAVWEVPQANAITIEIEAGLRNGGPLSYM